MNRTQVKHELKQRGFTGKVHFRKTDEFGQPDTFGPAIHRRLIDINYDLDNAAEDAERDNLETVVIYLEPKSFYYYRRLFTLKRHAWSLGEINGLRKGLGYCSPWSRVAKQEFTQDLMRIEFSFPITKEQTKFGINWLKTTQFNQHGNLRAAKTTFIGDREAAIIRTFKRFEFVALRFLDYSDYTGVYQTILPVYRVISKSSDSFEYSCNPMGRYEKQYQVMR